MILFIYLLGSFLFIASVIATFFLHREDITIIALWRMLIGASLSWLSILFFLLLFIINYLENNGDKSIIKFKK